MTENNAAQPGLTDEQILLTMRVHLNYGDGGYVCDTAPETVIAAGRALLSKLRAEGVQAGDERTAFEAAWSQLHSPIPMNTRLHDDGRYAIPSIEANWRLWQTARAALASAPIAGRPLAYSTPQSKGPDVWQQVSAPVAGEARPMDWQNAQRIAELPEVDEALANFCDDSTLDNAVGLVLAVLGAAPQASESMADLLSDALYYLKGNLPDSAADHAHKAAVISRVESALAAHTKDSQ